MEVLDCISTRHSCRKYTDEKIDESTINKILDAAIAAPSGKNGQPWRFVTISDRSKIEEVSDMSIYGKWMREATCFLCVFLDKEKSYHYVKDVQSCGAVIQNVLLASHALGVESCWIGEILINSDKVLDALELDGHRYELMAVITLGYSKLNTSRVIKKDRENFILRSF